MTEEKTRNVDVCLRYAVTGSKSAAEQAFRDANQIRQNDGPGYTTRLICVNVNPDECEGYRNYPTFSIAVWLKNDQPLYDKCRIVAGTILSEAETASRKEKDDERSPELVMADWLQVFVDMKLRVGQREDTANTDADRMFVQMAQAALSQVDWRELAVEWIQTVQEG